MNGGTVDLAGVTAVTICASSKFYDTARRVADELRQRGLQVFTPRFDYDEEKVAVSRADKAQLTHEFLDKIRRSQAVYVIDEAGYTGRSVCIEVGFAAALGKTIVLSEIAAEGAVAALTDAVVPADQFPVVVGTEEA